MFLNDLYPDRVTSSVYALDWETLAKRYKGVIFDIDNTLVPHGAPATEEAVCLFERIHRLGMKTMLVSNNGEGRVKPFADALQTAYVYKAGKPKKRGYQEAIRKMGISTADTLFLGDQIFTDVWGANRTGMDTMLTEPVDISTDVLQITVKRWIEWPFRHAKRRERRECRS